MDADRAVAEVLRRSTDVTDLVGERIYSGIIPEGADGALPYIATDTTALDVSYISTGEHNNDNSRVELTCVAGSNRGVIELTKAVRAAVSHYSGRVTITNASWLVQSIRLESYQKAIAQRETGSENWLHVGTMTLRVWTTDL